MKSILLSILSVILLVDSLPACTSFCLDTPNGPILGSNLDLFIPGDGVVLINQRGIAKVGFQESTTGENARWISKYGSVTFNMAGREFAFSGMNEAGLVIGSMELRGSRLPTPDERPPLTIATWVQYMLDTCADIDEVKKAAPHVRIEDSSTPDHYLIADATGACIAVEFLKGELFIYSGEKMPVKAMANIRYDRALYAYKNGKRKWWWANPGYSTERVAAAANRNAEYNPDRNKDAVSYVFETLTHIVAAPHTKWNLVYDIAQREVWYRSAASPKVKHLSLKNFDLSCDSPLLVLDVNAPVKGDVNKYFEPYSYDANLLTFSTFCDRYGITISAEATKEIMHIFDNYRCVHKQ